MGEKMDIGEICNRDVVFATEDMPLKQAAQLMREQHVGSLVVVKEAELGRVVTGMLTDRDIAIVAMAREFDPQTLRVADVMSSDPATARPEDSMYDVMRLMRQRGVRRIPVTTDKGVLVGIVALDDLLEIMAEQMQSIVSAIASETRREARIRV